MAALPVSWIQMLAGLALLGTISGSLYQALHNEAERDAAIVTVFGHGQRPDVIGDWICILGAGRRRYLLRRVDVISPHVAALAFYRLPV